MNTKHWLKGLVGAVVGGIANAVTLVVVDPQNFNLNEGGQRLFSVTLVSGLVAGAMYLKQSPVPPDPVKKSSRAKLPLLAALLIPFTFVGCATHPETGNAVIAGQEITPERVQRDIQVIAKIGAREGCKQDKNVEPYLQTVVVVLSVALDEGQYDPEVLRTALSMISVKEIRSESAQHYISDALDLYQNHVGDVVDRKLDKVKYLRPALTGLRDGIRDGLAQFNGVSQ